VYYYPMSNLLVINQVKEGIVDLNLAALNGNETVDELEHNVFKVYAQDPVLPSISFAVRRLFPTYLENKYPAAFSSEARVAMSGIMLGLFVLHSLPVDQQATKYFVIKNLELIWRKEDFLEIGMDSLGQIDFVPELIPQISLAKSEDCEQELFAGFGLVVSNTIEVYNLEHNHTRP